MAISYFNETSIFGKNYILNHFRIKKIKDNFLLVSDFGSWVILDKEEYRSLLRYNLSDSLFKMLEEKCIILTPNNIEATIHLHRKKLNYLFVGASLHIIVPTLRCNQKCIYCHSSAAHTSDNKKDMDLETADKSLEFIFQTPAKRITIEFQGGDSLLNMETFKHIVKKAKEMNKKYKKEITFELVTNLTLMNDEIFEWIIKEDVHVCTSLDGPKHVHDANRVYEKGAGTYDDVIKWMKRFKQADKGVGVLMVTTKNSIPYWKEIVDEYAKWGIKDIQVKPMDKLGYARTVWDQIGYTTDEFIDFWKKANEYIIELNKKGIIMRDRHVKLTLSKMLLKTDPSFLDFRNPCGAVIGQLVYNYDGDIFSCDEGRNYELCKLGTVFKDRYQEIILKDKSQALVSSSIIENLACDNCVYKPWCGTCPVLNYAENNNIIPKLPKSMKCKLFKAQFDYVIDKLMSNDKDVLIHAWQSTPRETDTQILKEESTINELIPQIYDIDIDFLYKIRTDKQQVFVLETEKGNKVVQLVYLKEKNKDKINHVLQRLNESVKINKTKNQELFFILNDAVVFVFDDCSKNSLELLNLTEKLNKIATS